MTIVSDAHKSIANAVREVYPGTTLGLCYYHVLKSIVPFGRPTVKMFQKAAYAYRTSSYDKAMGSIKAAKPEAYRKLMNIGPEKWARSMCPARRYSCLTSNAAESFNNRLLWARRLPSCSLVEAIRHIVEKWFDERRELAKNSESELTEETHRKLAEEIKKARTYTVVPTTNMIFKVIDGTHSISVNLDTRTCQCREFEMDLIPCSHGVAAIWKNGHSVLDYVANYYKSSTLIQTYSYPVLPTPMQDDSTIPLHIKEIIVLPRIINRQAGRPRNARHRSAVESRRRTSNNVNEASSSRRRAPKKCSVCQSIEHTRRTCPFGIRED